MGQGHVDEFLAANRRAEVIDWLGGLLPEFDLPLDSSDEELREYLIDGTGLCYIAEKLMPGIQEEMWGGNASDQRSNVKKFLYFVAEMGLPGFSVKDLEEGSVASVVECLLALKDNVTTGLRQNITNNAAKTPLRRKLELEESDEPVISVMTPGRRSGEERWKGHWDSKSQQRSILHSGQKVHDAFQLKRASYTDLPPAKVSEMMHPRSIDNAPTQSLLRVVNGILDESIERKRGEIPHRVVYLLRNVVQEIEHRIAIQADHIRNQNSIIKTREDKYRSKIKALETLVNGTNEENEMTVNRLELVEVEKSKLDEKRKLGEQDMVRLTQEKENAENTIVSLQQEIQILSRMHEQYRERKETEARQMEEHLSIRLKEAELLLTQSKKKAEEIESASQLKSQLWSRKANIFWSFMDNQKLSIKDIRISSQSIKQEMFALQMKWRDEISNIGHDLKGLVDAADNYHKVLAENQKLFNEVQELKGNIRVYCRVRPFLPGQDGKTTVIDYIGENGDILITNPFKQGKDACRMFKFNKVFNTRASQVEVFSDIQPLIRSVLDGFNVCIFAYGQTGSGKTYTMSGPGTSKEDWGVNYRALNDLFYISLSRRNAFSYEVGVQMVEIYNEQVRDLLSNDIAQKRYPPPPPKNPNGLVVPDASLHPVKSTLDVLELMEIGQTNRAVGSTALNERSSRSHSILTVHVRGVDLKNGSTSRGCLHLIDLAGSERVERSEAIGDRLKEAQYINKSLSALGDVIFALAQKNAHVPYRNSKLTQVLQSSLGGQAKTLMFVQINPDTESYSETISTLKFAERVSGVELGAARSNKEGKDIKELLEQVSYLKDTISRKDMEIDQLLKDKAKSPSSSTDINDSSQQIRRLSGKRFMFQRQKLIMPSKSSCGEWNQLFLTKNGQPANSKPKPRESALKPSGRTTSTGSQATGGGSSVKPPKRR
ncbi:P-loop nucleoside triphosphate hydrolase superfamily protein with CH (Calponin Homology) domain [Zea mays]|uniref:p-loop nucleoside triphosphate hydrolase superfamily protein with CH (Calponin Homology) domain n=1 Tax=Zea mays TaxID=4577 RepID=A0A1D6NCT4_MAIZE|nr:P-loop nucleoside triphosphate hydrolase superfamily protein with CH (Calponin Homology) domain [Zea mays]ONM38302.1 P-loop nucleoside triphosphate hydrolase superfamily protein with CH (Calponin Homology) domain [Zea mays]ONM38308.1 P-loop nucleoside triphosphate hydrolase superfamily protein with CH (Calponin Homology) domain [Zea mays]